MVWHGYMPYDGYAYSLCMMNNLRNRFLWPGLLALLCLLLPTLCLKAQPSALAREIYTELRGVEPAGRFVILYFSDDNCSVCFLEYQNFWKEYIRAHLHVPILGCLITNRPYIRETLLKEYGMDIPVHVVRRRLFDSIAPSFVLPRAVVYQADGRVLLERHMGEVDSLVTGADGYTTLERRLNALLVPDADTRLIKIGGIQLREDGDDVILGTPQIDLLPGGGYIAVDYKRSRVYFYDPDGTVSRRIDFKDSSFIGSRIVNLHHVMVKGDTLFCMGTIPKLLKKGPDSTQDQYGLQPVVYALGGQTLAMKISLDMESILPPLRLVGNALLAKVLPWSAMGDRDALASVRPLILIGFDGTVIRRFGSVDPRVIQGANPLRFIENSIAVGADGTIYHLDQHAGSLQRFTPSGLAIDSLDLFPMPTVGEFLHTQVMPCNDGSFYVLSYKLATKAFFLSSFGRSGREIRRFMPLPETLLSIVGTGTDESIMLAMRGEDGIVVERWRMAADAGR